MSVNCGSVCSTCDYPIRIDTYKGCSHACAYCFVRQKYDISVISPISTTKSLTNFINGKRNFETRWCDWNIPLHWGGNSDPFQICEKEHHKSLDCLKIFAETQYPFIVSTKNPVLLLEEPYFSLIQKCNCVLQVSMACSKYDKLEKGCPTYEERLNAVSVLSPVVQRIVVRLRPYFPDCHKDILKEIPRMANAGVYGICVAAFVSKTKQKGMTNYSGHYMFDNDLLFPKYKELKKVCHESNIKFLCSEPGLDHMSDSRDCCGCEGLKGFKPSVFNTTHLALDNPPPEPTEAMKQKGTYQPFKCLGQSQAWAIYCKDKTYAELMLEINADDIAWIKSQKEKYREQE